MGKLACVVKRLGGLLESVQIPLIADIDSAFYLIRIDREYHVIRKDPGIITSGIHHEDNNIFLACHVRNLLCKIVVGLSVILVPDLFVGHAADHIQGTDDAHTHLFNVFIA